MLIKENDALGRWGSAVRHIKVVVVAALIIIEAALAATPLVHTYVRDKYYVAYNLNLHSDGFNMMYLKGLSNGLTWRGIPEEVLLPGNASMISYVERSLSIELRILKYPKREGPDMEITGIKPAPEGLWDLPLTLDLLKHYLPKGNYLALLEMIVPNVTRWGVGYDRRLLSAIAYVNYGGETHEVVFDSPTHPVINASPNSVVSDVIAGYRVYVEPSWLTLLKVVSWVLYPVILAPTAALTYSLTRRRGARIALLLTLLTTSPVYAYGVVVNDPAKLTTYLQSPSHSFSVVDKPSATVLGIYKMVWVTSSNRSEGTIGLGKLIKPYEVEALKMLMNYTGNHELLVAITPLTEALHVKLEGAKKLSNSTYTLSINELRNAKLIIKYAGEGKYVDEDCEIYIGIPREVKHYLLSNP